MERYLNQNQITTCVCKECKFEKIFFPKIKLCKRCYYIKYTEKNKVKLRAKYFDNRIKCNEEKREKYSKDEKYRAKMKEKALSYYHYKKGESK